MASNTNFLGLLKKDPVADANDTFNIQSMLNENWDKIDAAYDMLQTLIRERAQIASGTVTGSSKAGADSPNSITFPFKPKMVYVSNSSRDAASASYTKFGSFLWVEGVTEDKIASGNYGDIHRRYNLEGNTLSWWVEDTNYSAAILGRYVAIG